MKAPGITRLSIGLSWLLFVAAIAWPALALVGRCVSTADAPQDGWAFSSRQWLLLWRTTWLASLATLLSLVLSLPAVLVLGRTWRQRRGAWLLAALMGVLLCPPMVYAFAWEKVLPAGFDPHLRCILVWAGWLWPVPAVLISSGWVRVGRGSHEAALLDYSPIAAFVRVGLPTLSRYIALSVLVVFTLLFNDYGVPHACGLLVYSTELLGWAQASANVIDTAWPAVLPAGVTAAVLLVVWALWRRCSVDDEFGSPPIVGRLSRGAVVALLIVLFGVWLLPVGALVARLGSVETLAAAWSTYRGDLGWTLATALLAGCLAVVMGAGLVASGRLRAFAFVGTVLFGVMPGALVGESLVAAYNHHATAWLYDHWPILVLSYVSRFGWIGLLAAMVATAQTPATLVAQARTDGAGEADLIRRVRLPLALPTLLAAVAVIAALAAADIATSSLVRVPAYGPIAHVLIEKFHRFEDGMLVSLSLWLVAATIPGALLGVAVVRWRRAT